MNTAEGQENGEWQEKLKTLLTAQVRSYSTVGEKWNKMRQKLIED